AVPRIPFRVVTSGPEPIRGDLRLPPPGHAAPAVRGAAVVVLHGFKGFKDWGFFPHACETLATHLACPVVSFNVRGSGIGPDLGSFSRPEGFAANTFGQEVEDLEAVVGGLKAGRLGAATVEPAERITLLGHSRGAVATALVAADEPTVRALATWGGLSDPGRYRALFPAAVARRGWAEIRNARTGEVLRLDRALVDELDEADGRLDPLAALARTRVPTLVLHGAADASVPLADARALAVAGGGAAEILPGAGHTFEAVHPFAGSTPALERALARTIAHFRPHIVPED
ncbi:MAG: alpha/beta fold hydrolase, partial [Gemmatimonadota bacterium]|nr:alpha/beta fold hydrolase [Gemmatimonadota bacterium]